MITTAYEQQYICNGYKDEEKDETHATWSRTLLWVGDKSDGTERKAPKCGVCDRDMKEVVGGQPDIKGIRV